MNISYAGLPFWLRAREVTDRDLDLSYRIDMTVNMQNRVYPLKCVGEHARRWADIMEDALEGEKVFSA